MTRLTRYSWFVLAYNLFVVVFGAFVRATGSGAGCGSHWPACQGVIIPRAPAIETIIEYTHRLTSGLTIVFIAILLVWTWRTYSKGSWLRKTSAAAVFFIIVEALLGAGLVLFNLVLNNASLTRAFTMMAHLVNTFFLLASLACTALFLTFGQPQKLKNTKGTLALFSVGVVGFFILGASGSIAALGDTLFPSSSLLAGIQQDFSQTSNYLLHLRIYHPLIAITVGGIALLFALLARRQNPDNPKISVTSTILISLVLFQLCMGALNVVLLAPVWLQLVHLLVTCLLWISYLVTGIFSLVASYLPLGVIDQEINHRVHQTTA